MWLLGAYSCVPSPPQALSGVVQFLQTVVLLCSARNGQDRLVPALQILSQQGTLTHLLWWGEAKFFRRLGSSRPSLTRQPAVPAT